MVKAGYECRECGKWYSEKLEKCRNCGESMENAEPVDSRGNRL